MSNEAKNCSPLSHPLAFVVDRLVEIIYVVLVPLIYDFSNISFILSSRYPPPLVHRQRFRLVIKSFRSDDVMYRYTNYLIMRNIFVSGVLFCVRVMRKKMYIMENGTVI